MFLCLFVRDRPFFACMPSSVHFQLWAGAAASGVAGKQDLSSSLRATAAACCKTVTVQEVDARTTYYDERSLPQQQKSLISYNNHASPCLKPLNTTAKNRKIPNAMQHILIHRPSSTEEEEGDNNCCSVLSSTKFLIKILVQHGRHWSRTEEPIYDNGEMKKELHMIQVP